MKYTKISIIIKSNEKPPYFIGSQIRGALGYALKKVSCINPSYNCDGCFASKDCLYYQFYEKKNISHKFRLDFELGKEFYDFTIFLFNDTVGKLPYILSAIHTMLTENGLGKDNVTYKNFNIYINDKNCIVNNQMKIPKDSVQTFEIKQQYKKIRLHFITPLRIKKGNRFLRDENIELKDLVNSIYQKQMQLLDNTYRKFPYEIQGNIITKKLIYKELTRHSNRQKTTMNLGGMIGHIDIDDLNKESYEVLKLGELIGIGKSTVFGLGKIKIEKII